LPRSCAQYESSNSKLRPTLPVTRMRKLMSSHSRMSAPRAGRVQRQASKEPAL
jgi:hypothetical protein